ncbi:hypothetical protein LguiA_034425 [Lonicera macranthoides]
MEMSEALSCSSAAAAVKNGAQQTSNYDELFMHRRLLFSDSLKDLKNLRKQLYSAAEYFESSYHKDDYNQLVVETLKDYVTKALISTVDHLGSVAFKVNSFVDEKVDEVSATKLRVSCIEKRLQTCQEYIDRGGLSQQSLVIKTPKYHKQYIIPGETMDAIVKTEFIYNNHSSRPEDHSHRPKNAFQATTLKPPPPSLLRKGNSTQPSPKSSSSPGTFSFTRVTPEKRTVSPCRFPLKRSESVTNRSISPNFSNSRSRYSSEPRRAVSLNINPEREIEHYSKKSKSLLKALLSIHKSKKDGQGKLYRYRDDY